MIIWDFVKIALGMLWFASLPMWHNAGWGNGPAAVLGILLLFLLLTTPLGRRAPTRVASGADIADAR